jgi:hypothetical protein
MSLIKLNNRAVKDVTQFGSITSLGSLTHISTATASSSASIEFTSGIDSTYKEYVFYFVNIHPATDTAAFQFNVSIDGGSNYNVAKTSTWFTAYHNEAGSTTGLAYDAANDLAQGTGDQILMTYIGNGADESYAGHLSFFNPSSTTFVKHFISTGVDYGANDYANNPFCAGYCNTTSAVDAVRFQMSSGNIDAGQILLFGVN